MKQFLTSVSCGAALALLAIGSAPATAAHIDTFEAGAFSVSGDAAEVSQTAPNADILGGVRKVLLTSRTPVNASLTVDSPDVVDNAVVLNFGDSGLVEFYYGAPFAALTPLNANFLNIPNSPLNWTHIEVDVDFEDAVMFGGDVTVGLFSNGAGANLTRSISAGEHNLMFLYSDFLAQNPSLDLTDIDAAGLFIEGNRDQTYAISFFGRAGAIPTPAALPAGVALMSIIALTRRHRSRLRKVN